MFYPSPVWHLNGGKYRCPLCNQEVTKILHEKIAGSRRKKERSLKDATLKKTEAMEALQELIEEGKKAIEKEQRAELKEKLKEKYKEELVMLLSYITRKGLI